MEGFARESRQLFARVIIFINLATACTQVSQSWWKCRKHRWKYSQCHKPLCLFSPWLFCVVLIHRGADVCQTVMLMVNVYNHNGLICFLGEVYLAQYVSVCVHKIVAGRLQSFMYTGIYLGILKECCSGGSSTTPLWMWWMCGLKCQQEKEQWMETGNIYI